MSVRFNSGNVVFTSNDKVAVCPDATPCDECSGSTPAYLNLTVSGVSLCACRVFTVAGESESQSYAGGFNPNGTLAIYQFPGDPCVYATANVTNLNTTYYDTTSTCTGPVLSSGFYIVNVRVGLTATTIWADIAVSWNIGDRRGQAGERLFYGSASFDNDCTGINVTINNTLTSGNCTAATAPERGYGGSITITSP